MRTLPFPKLSVLIVAAAIAGCTTVGPDYKVPADAAVNRPAAAAPFSGANNAAFAEAAVPGKWWRLYDDPQLDALITKALAANTDLRVAEANMERAAAATRQAEAARQPSVGVNAKPYFGHPSGFEELAPGYDPPSEWFYSMGASVSYTVDLVGQIRRAIEAADADQASAQAAYDAMRANVAAQTALAYATACTAGMQIASAQHSVDVQSESVKVNEKLQNLGRGTALDVTRSRGQLEQLRAAVPPLEAKRRVALYRLATLTGETPNQFPQQLAQCATPPELKQAIPVGDGAALLRRRPDIREAERAMAGATARIGVATGDLYPKITLGLSADSGYLLNQFGSRGSFGYSLGPLISWTIPNTGAVQARIAEAEASTKAAYARFDATVLNALRETESALTVYARELDRDDALKAARDQSSEAANQARKLYQYGKTDYLTVLDAERTLAGTESALAASQAEIVEDQIKLFLALGGGWEQNAQAKQQDAQARPEAAKPAK